MLSIRKRNKAVWVPELCLSAVTEGGLTKLKVPMRPACRSLVLSENEVIG